MNLRELFETAPVSMIPPNLRSSLLGKAAALATNDVQDKYNSTRMVAVNNSNNCVEVWFEMYAGSHVGVASLFKKRLKEVRLPVYSFNDKENFGTEHVYLFQFHDFPWDDYSAQHFEKGWKEVIDGDVPLNANT